VTAEDLPSVSEVQPESVEDAGVPSPSLNEELSSPQPEAVPAPVTEHAAEQPVTITPTCAASQPRGTLTRAYPSLRNRPPPDRYEPEFCVDINDE